MTTTPPGKPDPKGMILALLDGFLESDDLAEFEDFCRHVKFDLRALRSAFDLESAWLGHYRIRTGVHDLDRALTDFATWPPIANRIAELERERDAGVLPDDL